MSAVMFKVLQPSSTLAKMSRESNEFDQSRRRFTQHLILMPKLFAYGTDLACLLA